MADNNWHTGTPTEDGMYMLHFRDDTYDFQEKIDGVFDLLTKKEQAEIIAWQKIEEKEDGRTD